MCGVFLHTKQVLSSVWMAVGCPLSQFSSDTIYLEVASRSHRLRTKVPRLPNPSMLDSNCKPQVCVPVLSGHKWGSHHSVLSVNVLSNSTVLCVWVAHRTQGNTRAGLLQGYHKGYKAEGKVLGKASMPSLAAPPFSNFWSSPNFVLWIFLETSFYEYKWNMDILAEMYWTKMVRSTANTLSRETHCLFKFSLPLCAAYLPPRSWAGLLNWGFLWSSVGQGGGAENVFMTSSKTDGQEKVKCVTYFGEEKFLWLVLENG